MANLSIETQASFYRQEEKRQQELHEQTFQIFEIVESGRWVERLENECWPHHDGETRKFVAIVDNKACEISFCIQEQKTYYDENGHSERVTRYILHVNDTIVGYCFECD